MIVESRKSPPPAALETIPPFGLEAQPEALQLRPIGLGHSSSKHQFPRRLEVDELFLMTRHAVSLPRKRLTHAVFREGFDNAPRTSRLLFETSSKRFSRRTGPALRRLIHLVAVLRHGGGFDVPPTKARRVAHRGERLRQTPCCASLQGSFGPADAGEIPRRWQKFVRAPGVTAGFVIPACNLLPWAISRAAPQHRVFRPTSSQVCSRRSGASSPMR